MKEAIVIVHEAHSILDEQLDILNKEYPNGYKVIKAPSRGWNIEEMDDILENIINTKSDKWLNVIFISPIPYLIMSMTRAEFSNRLTVRTFHNSDCKKEECNDETLLQVSVIRRTGWILS